MELVTIDIETSPFKVHGAIDMMYKKCSCVKGDFREMYLHDDWNGTLHCNVCDKVTDRYITRSDYREEQINKILDE